MKRNVLTIILFILTIAFIFCVIKACLLSNEENPEFKVYTVPIIELTKNQTIVLTLIDYTNKDIPDRWWFVYQVKLEF
jgi:hypothetical protein